MLNKPYLKYSIVKMLLVQLCLLLISCWGYGQTYVGVLSGPNNSGEFYNNNSIELVNGFSSNPEPGQVFHAFITASDCVPIVTSLTPGKNYIISSKPLISGITNASQLSGRTTCEVAQSVKYFDNLGRPLQTILKQASPTDKDVIQTYLYDQFGAGFYPLFTLCCFRHNCK